MCFARFRRDFILSIHRFFNPKPLSVEEWAEKNSKLATPDDLIVGYLCKKVAVDFDNWTFAKKKRPNSSYTSDASLVYKPFDEGKPPIALEFTISDYTYYNGEITYGEVKINDEVIAGAVEIFHCWNKIHKEREKLLKLAAAKKAEMEANERRWNFAENLLGMKRLPNGALVPKDYEEPKPECTNKFIAPGDKCRSTVCKLHHKECRI